MLYWQCCIALLYRKSVKNRNYRAAVSSCLHDNLASRPITGNFWLFLNQKYFFDNRSAWEKYSNFKTTWKGFMSQPACTRYLVRAVSRKSEISWSCRRQAKLEGPYSSGIRLHDQENLTPISYKCLIMQSDSRDLFFPAIPSEASHDEQFLWSSWLRVK